MKNIIVQFNFKGLTAKQYDQSWKELRAVGMEHPAGLLHHVAGQKDNNWVVVDVWESAEAFDKFSKTLMPILEKIGFPHSQPVIMPVHYAYDGVEANITH